MVDDEYRRGAPEEHEWPAFWRMKRDWEQSRGVLMEATTVFRALGIIRKAAPYVAFITALALAALNADLLAGIVP